MVVPFFHEAHFRVRLNLPLGDWDYLAEFTAGRNQPERRFGH